MVRFEFAIGSGAFHQIVNAMQADHWLPRSWAEFRGYVSTNRDRLFRLTKHDPMKWASNVDRVFELGGQLARTGTYIATDAGAAVILVAAVAGIWLWRARLHRSTSN